VPLIMIYMPTEKEISNAKEDIYDFILTVELEKIALDKSVDSFAQLIWKDYEKAGVDVVDIVQISKEINMISNGVENIRKMIYECRSYLQLHRTHSSFSENFTFRLIFRRYSVILGRFMDSKKIWYSQKVPEILNSLKVFLNHHSENLKALIAEMESMENSNPNSTNHRALQLQKARLEGHIENLEKLRVRA
jgi:hypothetical protein